MELFFGNFLETWSYLGLFIVLMAASLGVPLPEDIPLILAGLVVSTGKANLYLMMLTGLIGVVLGDSTLYFLGRRYGEDIVQHRWLKWVAKPWLLEKARQKYHDHGSKILFAARFMPGFRAVLFLTAGVFRVSYWRLLIFDGGAGPLISVPVWVWAGYYFSERIRSVFKSAEIAGYVIVGGAVLGLIIWGCWEYFHGKRQARAASNATAPKDAGAPPATPAFSGSGSLRPPIGGKIAGDKLSRTLTGDPAGTR